MSRNEQINLIYKTASGATVTEHSITVFAAVKSATRAEFFAAYQVGLKPQIVFEVSADDWNALAEEPTEVTYKNKRYNIIRSFKTFTTIEVTCS